MNIITIGIIIFVGLMIVVGLSMYFILKDTDDVRNSKNIVYFFNNKCEDDFDELIEFSKSNDTKYKI